jgi:hypothetical protein
MSLEMRRLRAASIGRPLEITQLTPVKPARSQKGRPMWIYDGEQWIEEGVNEHETKPEQRRPPEEMYQPELQVIEVVPVPKANYVPPFPLP